ncbi:hypothetical protein K501DRAFT_266155 [Backusella circina FSU 941]|nr:hypothetical protein K501DRAFT_266155 [Backusella circina FSU 941]
MAIAKSNQHDLERSHKRIRSGAPSSKNTGEWDIVDTSPTFTIHEPLPNNDHNSSSRLSQLLTQDWTKSYSQKQYINNQFPYPSPALSSPPNDYALPITPSTKYIDIQSSLPSDYTDIYSNLGHISPQSSLCQDDSMGGSISLTDSSLFTQSNSNAQFISPMLEAESPNNTLGSLFDEASPSLLTNNPVLGETLNKIQFSYTDTGINLEAKISNASDLRSLIETFSQMCYTTNDENTPASQEKSDKSSSLNKIVLYRNKSNQARPVNFFETTKKLGQITNPHSSIDTKSSQRQIMDGCVETYFACWMRYKPIIRKDEFMTWYESLESPEDTLIVNAICVYVFRHMVIHHPKECVSHFSRDPEKVHEQEEYFFNCARECLSQSFDTPDRYTIAALIFMSLRAEPAKKHHYSGMASSSLQELNVYPRMEDEDVDSYDKEMDTRLWWFMWATDFSLWTAGHPKHSPQSNRCGKVDLPQVFEQDIDDSELGVLNYINCLKLWKIQSDIIAALYDDEKMEMTLEQVAKYDKQLLDFYKKLPDYLRFDRGFEYGRRELFLACLRVNIEYNATRIILHKVFIPEKNDTRPSQTSLESLNICLSAALMQLKTIKSCSMLDIGHCGFDRDELWRATEIISVAMEIYHNCVVPEDQAKILRGISILEFNGALERALDILKSTLEFQMSYKNCFQVADWIQVEIRRHQLLGSSCIVTDQHQNPAYPQPDYFIPSLKPDIEPQEIKKESKPSPELNISSHPSSTKQQAKKQISFQNQFSVASAPNNEASKHASNSRKSSFSAAPPFVQFDIYEPTDIHSFNGRSQARFRYFNPRKMNKFLFIDEHPMI